MGDQLTFYSGCLPHFVSHLAPIWHTLPEEYRGGFYARARAREEAHRQAISFQSGTPKKKPLVITASYEDYRAVNPAKVILVNHGAAQRYVDGKGIDNPCYSGGRGRERVVLNICPSESDAEVCRASGQLAAAVGVPKLDHWHPSCTPINAVPVVAISFHADIHVVPETRWAWPEYKTAIARLADRASDLGIKLLGHAHPRVHRALSVWWNSLGVEYTPHFDDVLNRANLYVIDNSSTAFEFASTGRPVVMLDASYYRRDVNHGGRFWDWADVGVRIQDPHDLEQAVLTALEDAPLLRKRRERIVGQVYDGVALDGKATMRAVTAILDYMDSDG